MKITKSQLKQLIKEETEKFLSELKLISEEEYSWIPKSEDLFYPWQNDEQDSKLDSKLPFPINPDARSNISDDYTRSGLSYRAASNAYKMQQNNPQKFTDIMADISKDGAMLGGDKPTPLNYPDPRKFEPGHIIIDPDTGEEIENPYAVDFGDPNDEFKEEIRQRLSDPNNELNDEFKEKIRQKLSDPKDPFKINVNHYNRFWVYRERKKYGGIGLGHDGKGVAAPIGQAWTKELGPQRKDVSSSSVLEVLELLDRQEKLDLPKGYGATVEIGGEFYDSPAKARAMLMNLLTRQERRAYNMGQGRRMRRGFRGRFN